MKYSVIAGVIFVAACLAATQTRVPLKSLAAVEASLNDRFRSGTVDPYDLLGTARCTYLEGYGALMTVELQLVYVTPPMPFRSPYSPQEIMTMHERKIKKLPLLKETMRGLLASASGNLEGMPGSERIAIEARLWHYSWEESKGIPSRVFMYAEKAKLMSAQSLHADLASVIVEQEQ